MDILISPSEYSTAFRSYLSTRLDLFVGLSLFAALVHIWVVWPRKAKIPILSRHHGWTASWKDAVDYLKDSPGALKEGYEKVLRDDDL